MNEKKDYKLVTDVFDKTKCKKDGKFEASAMDLEISQTESVSDAHVQTDQITICSKGPDCAQYISNLPLEEPLAVDFG
jgi:hypothetical protein